MDNLMYLKSGTDIRGTAIEKDGKPVDLTDIRLVKITCAYVDFLKKKLSKNDLSIAVGYDSRVSSPRIAKTVCEVLSALGVKVYNCGLSSTPSMFMSVVNFGVDSAVEITASHLPMEMNGLKFFTREGGFSGDDIKSILSAAQEIETEFELVENGILTLDNMGKYCSDLCK